MQDFHNCSLDALIALASREKLIDRHNKTDWIVALYVSDTPFIMNHSQAHIFLQGLIQGAWRERSMVWKTEEQEAPDLQSSS